MHAHTHTDFAAMAGLDYTSVINMPMILSAGMQSIDHILVDLINDPIFENNEVFQGTLTIISGERASLSLGTANTTIIEDEGMYMYTLSMHVYYLTHIISRTIAGKKRGRSFVLAESAIIEFHT